MLRRLILLLCLGLPALTLGADANPAQPLRLLMVLWRGETPAEQGFIDELRRQRVAVAITRIDAAQNRAQLAQQFWAMGARILAYDAIYSFGTTASVMTRSIVRGRVLQLYSMVSDPQEAGLVAGAGEAPLTGTTDAIAAELKLRTAQQLFPIRHIGFLFNARERNARVQLEEMERLCGQLGIALSVLRVAPESSSLEKQLRRLQQDPTQFDTLFLPSDSYLISQSATIMAALAHTPYRVFGATDGFVRDGALLAVAPDYPALGRRLAQRLIALTRTATGSSPQGNSHQGNSHQGQQPPQDLSPIGVERAQILYNERTRARLGIEFPATLRTQMTPIR